MGIGRREILSGLVATSAVGFTTTAAGALTRKESAGVLEVGLARLTVSGSNLRLSTAGRAAPGPGERVLLSAELEIEGLALSGTMHGDYLVIDSPGTVGTSAPTSIETHYFDFPGGSLVGSGTASLDDAEDQFVVLGGTGAFAGVRGSYAAIQRPVGLGGDGTAIYQFAFLTQQGS
jgi:hypothetical protein